ncbi:MAG: FkbM family methyltransferase [Sphingomonas sp.]|uniref:FkbM family methyltransferase n=1 Tax=Sphingomonas sp. TaxID=28214 RepID=UPI001AD3CB6B|nr:FkbM family methyltransferase [Sphingomonas sp.]MBN8806901.1 FkbM family methyltransferase [Sphingomonas sp.]
MRLFVRSLAAATRFAATWADWGFSAAYHQAIIARFAGDHSFKTKPSGVRFHYRGIADYGVLHFFTVDQGYFETHSNRRIETIVDAGGNIGCFSTLARAHYPDARIFGFEIDRSNFDIFAKNLKELGNAVALRKALWKSTGPVAFIQGETTQAHSVATPDGDPDANLVDALSLADLMQQEGLERIDILKMDIEGAEGEVMGNMSQDVLSRVNAIIFECNDSEQAGASIRVVSRLLDSDFDGFAFGENLYFVRRSTGWQFRRRQPGLMPIWRQPQS